MACSVRLVGSGIGIPKPNSHVNHVFCCKVELNVDCTATVIGWYQLMPVLLSLAFTDFAIRRRFFFPISLPNFFQIVAMADILGCAP